MKNTALKTVFLACLVTLASQAQAGLWDDTKETASSAWQKTKETSHDLKEGAVQKWQEATADKADSDKTENSSEEAGALSGVKKLGEKETYVKDWEKTKETSHDIKEGAVKKWHEVTSDNPKESADNSGSLSDVKKLGDKETYIKAWEGIKESAKNPGKPNVDENGVPKSE